MLVGFVGRNIRPPGLLLLLLGGLALACPAGAEHLPAAERAKIEALIGRVEGLHEATFVRNGRAYEAATAAVFLRRKWAARTSRVTDAEGFIAEVATASSTTGRPYLIRLPDGREIPCGEYLRAELDQLEAPRAP